jgi:hypothetical protein
MCSHALPVVWPHRRHVGFFEREKEENVLLLEDWPLFLYYYYLMMLLFSIHYHQTLTLVLIQLKVQGTPFNTLAVDIQ